MRVRRLLVAPLTRTYTRPTMRSSDFAPVLIAASSCLACSADDATTGPKDDGSLRFGSAGSLASPAGRGSFRFGAASAATQIEDGNAHTDWFVFTQPVSEGGLGHGAPVGDASRGYTLALPDVTLLQELGVDSYRFSMEWARIEPERDVIDEAALAHYSDFVDALLAAHIRPVVTLHHFSNPVWIDDPRDTTCAAGPTDQNLCGWGHATGGAQVIEEFREHAELLATRFGDRVDDWGTLNEPVNYLVAAYGAGQFPPGKLYLFQLLEKFVPVVRDFIAGSSAAYDAVKAGDTIDADGDGSAADVGLSLNVIDWQPARDGAPSTHPDDIAARDKVAYVYHHLLVRSLLDGTFDADLDGVADEQHPEWQQRIDWLGLQYYSRNGVTAKGPLLIPVLGARPCFPPQFDDGACLEPFDLTHCVPAMQYEYRAGGLFDLITDFSTRYPSLPLAVTEGGIATRVGERRAENIVRSLEQIQRAQAGGADVRGYYHWSLYDNFEWSLGFEPRFGLYAVDYTSYARTPTLGADVYGAIARSRELSARQRETYGGEGPMTPEPIKSDPYRFCTGQ